jgi:dUTP pyrophosphatase
MAASIPDILQVQRLSPDATIPTRGSKFAAGYDLYASKDMTILKGGRAVVPTDITIAVPPSTYGRVAPRSGLAVKHGINTGAGVIDEDYRGPVGVVLFNHGEQDFQGTLPLPTIIYLNYWTIHLTSQFIYFRDPVKKGDRIAQLVIERIVTPEV